MARYKECREQKGLSQKAAAISLGVKSPSVSGWETGKTQPTIDNLIAMADLYGVTVDYLLDHNFSEKAASECDGELMTLLGSMPAESRNLLKGFIQSLMD